MSDGWLSSGIRIVAAVALVLVLVLGASISLITRRVLAGRRRSLVLPADEFDPTSEDVERFALAIGRLQRIVGRFLDRRGRALRVEMRSIGDGAMAWEITAPEDRAAAVEAAMYSGVELRDPAWLALPGLGAQGQGVRPVGRRV